LCRRNNGVLIYIAVAAALGILLGRILPTGLLVFILGLAVVGIGVFLLLT